MMKPTKKTAIQLLFILGLFTTTAHADMDELMKEMYMATATTPQAVRTQNLYGLAGGSLTFKAPVKSINVIGLSLPSARFGCNGMSIYGGSFSIINKDEIIAIFRQVVANAASYAMELAFSNLCEQCWSVVKGAMEIMQENTEGLKNTCQMAQSLLDKSGVSDALTNWNARMAERICTARGTCDDAADATEETVKNPDKMASENPEGNTLMGNSVFMALNKSEAYKRIPWLSPKTVTTLIMSLTGTVIYAPGDGSTGGDTATKVTPKKATLSYADFMYPSDKHAVHACVSGDVTKAYAEADLQEACTGLREATLKDEIFEGYNGVDEMVQQRLSQIRDIVVAGQDASNNPEINGFIDRMPLGTLKAMQEVRNHAPSLSALTEQIHTYIVSSVAEAVFIEVDHILSRMYLIDEDYVVPPGVKDIQDEIRRERSKLRSDPLHLPAAQIRAIDTIVNNYKKHQRAAFQLPAAQNTSPGSK